MKSFIRRFALGLVCGSLVVGCGERSSSAQSSEEVVPVCASNSVLEGSKPSTTKLLADDVVAFCVADALKDPEVVKLGRVDASDFYFYHDKDRSRVVLEFSFKNVKGLRVAYVFEGAGVKPNCKVIYSLG